jgi:hypothetical protein
MCDFNCERENIDSPKIVNPKSIIDSYLSLKMNTLKIVFDYFGVRLIRLTNNLECIFLIYLKILLSENYMQP